MREQRELRLRHPFPKPAVSRVVAVNILAVGQKLQHHRPASEATFQFIQRIRTRGMDRNSRQKLRMLFGQCQHITVRHIKRPEGQLLPGSVVDLIVRQDHHCAQA
jgi:hypothetical protein